MKKQIAFFVLLLLCCCARAQEMPQSENIFLITTDGFRWQEVFNGADSSLLCNPSATADTALARLMYWAPTAAQRRARLLPFFWNVIAAKGQLAGNRQFSNYINAANLYKISYPGYNEMLTGYADPGIFSNKKKYNPNTHILEQLNQRPAYKGRVVAFSSWDVFPFIMNEKESGIPVYSGYEPTDTANASPEQQLINTVQEKAIAEKTGTRHDLLTFLAAKEYIRQHHPKIVLLSLGETDEYAHSGRYDLYLQRAQDTDRMIAELWYYVQTDPAYQNKTTFIITTDHGRGNTSRNWQRHDPITPGSGELWMAALGAGIVPLGEIKSEGQFFLKDIPRLIAALALPATANSLPTAGSNPVVHHQTTKK
jgi:Type I phosphodiesterase / nucleotide pyrophosphatase